jgi:hypothetical protein
VSVSNPASPRVRQHDLAQTPGYLSSKETNQNQLGKNHVVILTKAIPQRLYLELKGQTQQPGRSPINAAGVWRGLWVLIVGWISGEDPM